MGLNRNLGNLTEVIKELNGNIGIGLTPATGSQYKLDVVGSVRSKYAVNGSNISLQPDSPQVYLVASSSDSTYGDKKLVINSSGLSLRAMGTSTAAIEILSNGYVGIGTTSPSSKLHIIQSSFNPLRIARDSVSDYSFELGGSGEFYIKNNLNSVYPISILSSGNVGIGTTSPFSQGSGATTMELAGNTYGQFFVSANSASSRGVIMARASTLNDVYIASITNSPLAFGTNDTERMRITSGGNVGIGTTSPITPYALTVFRSAQGGIAAQSNGGGDANFYSQSSTIGFHFYGDSNGAKVYILNNGDVRNANNSYGAISDIKLKENIVDASPKLNDLMKVKIRNYNLIDDENKIKQIGVIAQELEEVFPNMISEDKMMGSDEKIKTVKYSVFVPMLVKAIQELKAEIEILKNK